ncbi:MAG TPA: CocE/NonD family hydrolase [Acidimicrobiales bacterium]|nr:CocE/NonD family hydrolase [Acidimicrobiales bacterium]
MRIRAWTAGAAVIGLAAGLTVTTHRANAKAPTPYPGGLWQPPPPAYGVQADKNVTVRMDDGAGLVADVYYPADPETGQRAPGRFPVLLTQTPYTGSTGLTSATGSSGPGDYFVERGYIFVSADVRGTGRSGGNGGFFSPRDARDGVDLVDWVAHHLAGSNGVVGLTGCSYLGQTQLYTAALLGPRSPVKAMVPACVSGDVYRDTYLENGIPSPAWDGAGLAAGALLGPTIEADMVPQYLASQTDDASGQAGETAYDKTFWLERDHIAQARAVAASGIPALMWDGWVEPGFGAQELWAALENAALGRSPYAPLLPGQSVTGRYQLIVGNWTHGGGLDNGIMLEWYDTWLKGRRTGIPTATRTPVHLQELGTSSPRWVNVASYPLTNQYRPYYLDAGGTLGSSSPSPPGSDPLVWAQPTVAGSTITFTSGSLTNGALLAGPSALKVWAASDTTELQLMADLYDLAPDGTATAITHGGMLGSLHALDPSRSWADAAGLPVRPFLSLQRDTYIPAGAVTEYQVPLYPKLWELAPGHRLQLRLSTQADERDCMTAMERIVWPVLGCKPRPAIVSRLAGGAYTLEAGGRYPSVLSLPLLPYGSLPAARSGVTPTSAGVVLPQQW